MSFKNLITALVLAFATACSPSFRSAAPASTAAAQATEPRTQVMLLATLHGIHRSNPDYTYADVYKIIEHFAPDVIGVEIRPEDIGQDTTYLKQMYPLEMRQITVLFPKDKLVGFDWYGKEAAGNLLHADAFKGKNKELTRIKQLEREMNADTTLSGRMAMIAILIKKQIELARTSSPAAFNNSGHYELITEIFYDQLDVMMAGTPYETYTTFNRQRDEHIGKNIVETIRRHPGQKLIFVMGANHRFAAKQHIQQAFGQQVQMVEVPQL